MKSQPVPKTVKAAARRRRHDRNAAKRPSDSADALEPGIASEIMASGQGHRRWGLQPGPETNDGARSQSIGSIPLTHGNPHNRRQGRVRWNESESEIAFRSTSFDLF